MNSGVSTTIQQWPNLYLSLPSCAYCKCFVAGTPKSPSFLCLRRNDTCITIILVTNIDIYFHDVGQTAQIQSASSAFEPPSPVAGWAGHEESPNFELSVFSRTRKARVVCPAQESFGPVSWQPCIKRVWQWCARRQSLARLCWYGKFLQTVTYSLVTFCPQCPQAEALGTQLSTYRSSV